MTMIPLHLGHAWVLREVVGLSAFGRKYAPIGSWTTYYAKAQVASEGAEQRLAQVFTI